MKTWHIAKPIETEAIRDRLSKICGHYEKTAPTVSSWADGLYQRINRDADHVTLSELLAVDRFVEDGQWEHPNLAANRIYKLMHRLGQDTTGHAGF